jgi:hypothetical protein
VTPVAEHPFVTTLQGHFGGGLGSGSHEPNGVGCALEVASVARGIEWTDDPDLVGLPDLRPLNDGPWSSDKARAEAIAPVIVALWDWADWPDDRRQAWAGVVAERTILEILPPMLRAAGLDAEAERCEREGSAAAAHAAAYAAYAANAARAAAAYAANAARAAAAHAAAAHAARAAAAAARAAAAAAHAAAANAALVLACRIWIEAAA